MSQRYGFAEAQPYIEQELSNGHVALLFDCLFFFNDTATTEIYTLSLHDALPITADGLWYLCLYAMRGIDLRGPLRRSEEHTSELQSRPHLVCRLLLEKKKKH